MVPLGGGEVDGVGEGLGFVVVVGVLPLGLLGLPVGDVELLLVPAPLEPAELGDVESPEVESGLGAPPEALDVGTATVAEGPARLADGVEATTEAGCPQAAIVAIIVAITQEAVVRTAMRVPCTARSLLARPHGRPSPRQSSNASTRATRAAAAKRLPAVHQRDETSGGWSAPRAVGMMVLGNLASYAVGVAGLLLWYERLAPSHRREHASWDGRVQTVRDRDRRAAAAAAAVQRLLGEQA